MIHSRVFVALVVASLGLWLSLTKVGVARVINGEDPLFDQEELAELEQLYEPEGALPAHAEGARALSAAAYAPAQDQFDVGRAIIHRRLLAKRSAPIAEPESSEQQLHNHHNHHQQQQQQQQATKVGQQVKKNSIAAKGQLPSPTGNTQTGSGPTSTQWVAKTRLVPKAGPPHIPVPKFPTDGIGAAKARAAKQVGPPVAPSPVAPGKGPVMPSWEVSKKQDSGNVLKVEAQDDSDSEDSDSDSDGTDQNGAGLPLAGSNSTGRSAGSGVSSERGLLDFTLDLEEESKRVGRKVFPNAIPFQPNQINNEIMQVQKRPSLDTRIGVPLIGTPKQPVSKKRKGKGTDIYKALLGAISIIGTLGVVTDLSDTFAGSSTNGMMGAFVSKMVSVMVEFMLKLFMRGESLSSSSPSMAQGAGKFLSDMLAGGLLQEGGAILNQ